MYEDAAHTQRVGHQTGMLPTRPAKALQGVAGHIMAALHTDFANGIGHIVDRNPQETLGQGSGRHRGIARSQRHLLRKGIKFLRNGFCIQRQITARAKDRRKMIRRQLA